jgi:hypothetical protein
LGKFPTTEIAARSINASNWNESLFNTQQDGGKEYITVPRNIESFSESLFMITLLKLFEVKGWIPALSEKDLPPAVLETKEGGFFAGFVSASLKSETGEMASGTSKYSKGVRAFQTFSVEKARGKSIHLRTGGMDKLTERLSGMKGFTKEYWGMRGALAAIFKSIPPSKVSNLNTYFMSKPEIMKNIKTRLLYKNGGVFRPEELTYLDSRYATVQTHLDAFLARLDSPDMELANNFSETYANLKTEVERCDNEIRPVVTARARILFPQDKRKKTIQWTKQGLSEKLYDLEESKLMQFLPETLPGVTAQSSASDDDRGSPEWMASRYGRVTEETIIPIIRSWYADFDSSSKGDE